MIPALTKRGLLPAGVHDATIEEIRSRFGRQNAVRRRLMKGLEAIAVRATAAGGLDLYVNGSFVTSKPEPGDWDGVVVLPLSTAAKDLRFFSDLGMLRRNFHTDLFALFEDDSDVIEHYVKDVFTHERDTTPKGILRVTLKRGTHGTDQE